MTRHMRPQTISLTFNLVLVQIRNLRSCHYLHEGNGEGEINSVRIADTVLALA